MADEKSDLERLLDKHSLTEEELEKILKQSKRPKVERNNTHEHFHSSKRDRFIATADWHVGHKNFRYDCYDGMQKVIKKHKVDKIYHCGDLIEGMSNREGHIYELSHLGVSSQLKELTGLIKDLNIDFYFILGNHCDWVKNKSNQGFKIGEYIEDLCKNTHYLGDMRTEIKLSPNVKMWLTHEGSTAYALSYSAQKRINSIFGGIKPNVWLNGHIHKSIFMEYRNVKFFEAGCLQQQTDFMAMKGSPAHVGFWLIDVYHNKQGINEVKSSWFPYY